MNYGITSHQLNLILECFKRFPEIQTVTLFGSRAMGNFKPGSDVDLMIEGTQLSAQTMTRLFGCLNEEVSVPFTFDLVRAPIAPELAQHIARYGVVIFQNT